ncbi:non-specific lipid transfer protein GPI-anchored 1-like [Cornus florida]|uniref:non-specific lipid transfer protein GPI-anchored 1-like n=1 Tax=Cornus florida TaxID=4283 RepID=UPI00289D7494|nr:non-specific lipid transfer protein GPI-anchored 1-like [Cornus florida]
MTMKKMGFLIIISTVLFVCGSVGEASTNTDQCTKEFDKVTACLNYATAKAATPTKDCCDGVTELKTSKPVCLCYFIQQTHNGSQEIKSLGIQEARLLQLPSACKLANASVSDCPKLLNIPVTSPDYAIFTNFSSSITPTTTPVTADDSSGSKHGVLNNAGVLAAIATVIVFLCVFPAGVASSTHARG